jgi:hypothetical protein
MLARFPAGERTDAFAEADVYTGEGCKVEAATLDPWRVQRVIVEVFEVKVPPR